MASPKPPQSKQSGHLVGGILNGDVPALRSVLRLHDEIFLHRAYSESVRTVEYPSPSDVLRPG